MQRQFKEFGVSRREREQAIVGLAENSTYNHRLARRLSQAAIDEDGGQRKQRKNKQGAISLTPRVGIIVHTTYSLRTRTNVLGTYQV